ncbi:PIG-L deacetylase family protein [Streptomyces rubiginosohelvolus]|uniref:PIG-L deacetylase family protein n=1 Tax=Streptomyces rubiginosohelvolus TaxID=67362 RepID=UPI0035DB459B
MSGVRTAIAISPHLDDAVFSAGGVLALLARTGWYVRVVTCFTATVEAPCSFALSTQLDKGLSADVDYMALRRAEDRAAQQKLGLLAPIHLPLPEAPHRGYNSPRELFMPPHDDDTAGTELRRLLRPHLLSADLVLAPQAIGNHLDHVITAMAVAAGAPPSRTVWWRDMPYAARAPQPGPGPSFRERNGTSEVTCDIGTVLAHKAAAAHCYTTQLGFQFGGPDRVTEKLSSAARSEAIRTGAPHVYGEVLRARDHARRLLEESNRPGTDHSERQPSVDC